MDYFCDEKKSGSEAISQPNGINRRILFTKEYFIKTYGLEDEDFEIREDLPPVMPPQFKEFKEQDKNTFTPPGQEQIENLYKFISEEKLNEQAQKLLNPIISLVDACNSYECNSYTKCIEKAQCILQSTDSY